MLAAQSREIILPHNNWRPRRHQRKLWNYLQRGGRRALAVCHRRWGKDEIALHWTACALHERVANYWHCLPEYAQARKAIWEAVNPHSGKRRIDEAFPKELRATTREQEMTIVFRNGSTWRVVGSDNPNSLVGAPPAGIIMSEYALSNPAAWAYLAPILEENGGWAIFISTPRGRNHMYSMYDMAKGMPHKWLAFKSDVYDSGFPLHLVEEARLEYHGIFGRDAGDALIEQEYFCSFDAAVLGAFWGRVLAEAWKEGRVREFDIDPNFPVHRAWDLGLGAHMVIWFFQIVGGEIRVVDFVQGHAVGIPGFAKIIREEKNIRGGIDYVPHDAVPKELGTEKSRVETMIELGLNPEVVALAKVEDGINAGERVIPRCWFRASACKEGLEGLANYRADWDQDTRRFTDQPVKDWSEHIGSAFRYLALSIEEVTVTKPKLIPGALHIATPDGQPLPPNQVLLDDLLSLGRSARDDNPMGY
jgi:phage terminase large subunit